MTTLQMQHMSHFGIPATEDPMEVTSDNDRRLGADGDIDIDIDITGGNQQNEEDESMEENIDEGVDQALSNNEHTMREESDDGMVDDSDEGSIAAQNSLHDENIEDADYTLLEVDEDTVVEPTLEDVIDPSQEVDNQRQTLDSWNNDHDHEHEHEHHTSQLTPAGDSAPIADALLAGQQQLAINIHGLSELATQELLHERNDGKSTQESSGRDQTQDFAKEASASPKNEVQQLQHSQRSLTSSKEDAVHPRDPREVATLQSEGNEQAAVSFEGGTIMLSTLEEPNTEDNVQDEVSSKTLPPVVVRYQGNDIFLFPLVGQDEEHSETFFLSDERHADETIRNLLGALRSVLAQNIDESDDLMISIVDLGLEISEADPESSSVTLREIVDIYVHLQINDGHESLPQLYINLTSKSGFLHRMEHLQNAIVEGKGLSQLQSSKVIEDDQQYNDVDDPGYEPEDQAHLLEPARTPQIEGYGHDGVKWTQPTANDSQSNLPMPSQYSPALGTRDHAIDAEEPENNNADSQLDTNKDKEKPTSTNGDATKAALIGDSLTASATPDAREGQRQILDEPVVEDADFVDYEDIEDLAQSASSGSSTLQGDLPEVTPEQDLSEVPRPTARVPEAQTASEIQGNITEGDEISRDLVDGQRTTPAAGVKAEGPSDVVREEVEYPDYSDEDNASSSDAIEKEEEKEEEEEGEEEEDEEEGYTGDQDDTGARQTERNRMEPLTNAAGDHNVPFGYRGEQSVPYDVQETQEHKIQVFGENNLQFEETFDSGNEEQGPSSPLEDEYDFGHASPHEEQTALDDLSKEDHPIDLETSSINAVVNGFPKAMPKSEQDAHDDDEITYEDEDDAETPQQSSHTEHNITSSPGSLKRVRNFDKEDGVLEGDLQGGLSQSETRSKGDGILNALVADAKRIRSA
ncbi:hypothetical protein P7C71_g1479, partial [Lecanoromycetidae sp. Uapishka_2]